MAYQITAAPSLTKVPVWPCRFMALSTELRLAVYNFTLSGPHDVTLRSPKDLEVRRNWRGQRLPSSERPIIRKVGVLMASKQVYSEAMPIFYDMNRFHYTIVPSVASVQGVLPHFTMHLHFMQDVSIDYMLHTAARDISEADRLVSTRIQSVIDRCPNLRTFKLHLLTFFENKHLHRAFPADSRTAVQLSRLAARLQDPTYCLEYIAIVAHGNRGALVGLRDGIAPSDEWVVRELCEWPDISIDGYQEEGMERREDGRVSQKIRMFYLWPDMRRHVGERDERLLADLDRNKRC